MADFPPPTDDSDARYESFVSLFVAHEVRLRGFLRSLLPGWDSVDDVMQETSLVAWRKYGQFVAGTNFMAWAASIARFEALKHLRQRGRERLVFSDEVLELIAAEPIPERSDAEREQAALERCLKKLTGAQRGVLDLAYAPGMKLHEAALRAGRNVQAFYKTVQRLRVRLGECVRRELASSAS